MTEVREKRRHHRVLIGVVITLAVLVAGWFVFQWVVEPDGPPAFYTPPSALPEGPPGTIVREESVDPFADGQRAWRVLYTSTDPQGAPIAVSGVVVAPSGEAPDGGWPVVAWAHGTTGIEPSCAPSLLYPATGMSRVPELTALVEAGTVVAVTDYPGLGTPGIHPYLVGESEGRAVLDSMRAARALLGDDVGTRAAVFGHSQGGHAAVYADRLAASYAPELDLAGVAAMAPPTDLGALVTADQNEALGIVLTALAITSWSSYYPDTDAAAVVDPVAQPIAERLGERCVGTTLEGISDLPDVAALEVGFLSADPATAPGWGPRLAENSPDSVPADVPLLVAQGLDDTLVRPDITKRFVQTQCAAGVGIQFDTYAGVDHFGVRTAAAPAVRDWLLARLAGDPAATGCSTNEQPAGG